MVFTDKIVLVIGASSGIGAAIAVKFAETNAKVAIVGRNEDNLKKVSAKCNEAFIIIADVTKDDDCKRIVAETIAKFGRLDILINNVGITKSAAITEENAMQVFDQVMATNLRGPVYITHLAVPYLIKTKGNIINISSIGAIRNISKKYFAIDTSKAALDHFTRSAALSLASNGVRVNAINPGPVRTDIIKNSGYSASKQEAIWEMMTKMTPLERISEPEEIADLVLFLASDKAKAITGASYVTDNGMLLINFESSMK